MLIAIGMIVMVSRIPKAFWLIPIAFAEFNLRSDNLPLHTTNMGSWNCLRTLNSSENNAVLELPLRDGDPLYNQQSLRQRFHKRPLVNPFILPPFVSPPSEWRSIQQMESIRAVDGERPLTDTHLSDLRNLGVGLILVDRILLPNTQQERINTHLHSVLGAPITLQCAYVWTLNDQIISVEDHSTPLPYSSPVTDSTQEPL